MKKLLTLLMATCLAFATLALAQDTMKNCDMGKASAGKAPLMTLKGTVKADGDKITFVNDADQKIWDVMNPETLKGHEGHHVQLSAHVYADKSTIHVMKVKMLKQAAEKPSSM
jgi:Spy/CpxP family protein refolding chaperone